MSSVIVILVLISIFISIYLVYAYEVPTGISFFTLSLAFLLFDLIETDKFLSSFFDETLLTIVMLIFIARGFEYNFFIKYVRKYLLKGNNGFILFKLNFFSIIYSMFVNNAAVVSTMIGILKNQKNRERMFLMSVSFASILGGMLTLVGTSTNLILNNLKVKAGLSSWAMFDFFQTGLFPAILGLVYLSIFSKKIFSYQELSHEFDLRIIETKVKENSDLLGKSIEENGLRNLKKMFLGEVIRENGKIISPAAPTDLIQKGDTLIFIGDISDIKVLENIIGLVISNSSSTHSIDNIKEVLITDESDLIGLTPKSSEFRSRFNSIILAIRRGSIVVTRNIGEQVIRSGDQLSLVIGSDFKKTNANIISFKLLESSESQNSKSNVKSLIFLILFFLVLFLNFLGILALFKGAIIVLIYAMTANLLTLKTLKTEIPFNLVMTVGSAFVISNVLKSIEAPELILTFAMPLLINLPVYISLLAFFIFVILLTEFVSNAVAAGIAFPFAISLASSLSFNQEPFLLVTVFGASASFLTPFGYHTNMMVYSIGHYSPSDFFKLGFPLTIIYILSVYFSILFQFNMLPWLS